MFYVFIRQLVPLFRAQYLLQVTRWYPDHLAAQCYGCERGFWLATRKHHCRFDSISNPSHKEHISTVFFLLLFLFWLMYMYLF